MSNLYISKKQLSILTLGLMSLTREEKAFNYGLENGIFTEDDIYDYVETLRTFAGKIDQQDGAILSTEINFDDVDHKDCVDLSGISLDGGIQEGKSMIILNILGVILLYLLWKMERSSAGSIRDMDTVTGFLLPLMIAVSICWIIFDLIFMVW